MHPLFTQHKTAIAGYARRHWSDTFRPFLRYAANSLLNVPTLDQRCQLLFALGQAEYRCWVDIDWSLLRIQALAEGRPVSLIERYIQQASQKTRQRVSRFVHSWFEGRWRRRLRRWIAATLRKGRSDLLPTPWRWYSQEYDLLPINQYYHSCALWYATNVAKLPKD